MTETTIVKKTRRLPLPGIIRVNLGDKVSFDTVVADCTIPGDITTENVAGILDFEPDDINTFMLKKVGEKVGKDEPIAMTSLIFGRFKKYVRSPIEGNVEQISEISGQVVIRGTSKPLSLRAYMPGTISSIIPNEGVIIETYATFIQGIFGIGGETYGEIRVIESSDEILTPDHIRPDCSGKIIVGGCLVTTDVIKKAIEVGVKGIVVGGMHDKDLVDFVGHEIGVAITGHEDLGLVLILTEGFGQMNMSAKTFALLKKYSGKLACINGATQIRAGVIRPEIIIPRGNVDISKLDASNEISSEGLKLGTSVRIIGEPYFGALGYVHSLPVELQYVETESKVRVLEVELEDGRRVIVPRANVEIIEGLSENRETKYL